MELGFDVGIISIVRGHSFPSFSQHAWYIPTVPIGIISPVSTIAVRNIWSFSRTRSPPRTPSSVASCLFSTTLYFPALILSVCTLNSIYFTLVISTLYLQYLLLCLLYTSDA